MLCKKMNPMAQILIKQLLSSIKQMKRHNSTETNHSGVYKQADASHKLLLSGSRNFIFEFYDSPTEMNKEMAFKNKVQFLQQLQNAQFEHLISVSKKSHFTCFEFLGNLAVKAIFDYGDKSYLYIPIHRFSQHIVNYQSSLGICHFELMQYFNFLDLHYQNDGMSNCFVINIYKNSRISIFSYVEVQSALNEFLIKQNQPMDLSITGRYL